MKRRLKGETWERVVKSAKTKKASLIAVTSAQTPAGAFFLGSVSRSIVRAADQPVLVLHVKRQKQKQSKFRESLKQNAKSELIF